ncbi:MAG: hypothetical protein KKE98_06070 [Nanoarchaeota archaeon]|nr:hypothetical protein [Nanoarchaeota archaeon]MBU2441704.1 hypothetical protein [Nanoarchaeota archaeon]
MVDKEPGKYARLAILAGLVEPKSLSELGMFWYNENGRFYKQKARQEIEQAVKNNFLIKEKSKYRTNTEKIILSAYSQINNKELKALLCMFWNHPFSQKTFLCCKAIKQMFNNNPEIAAENKPQTILNTPLILHQLQEKDNDVYNLFVSMQGLEAYTNQINKNADKNMDKEFENLKDKTDWLSNLNKIIKNDKILFKGKNNKLKITNILKK